MVVRVDCRRMAHFSKPRSAAANGYDVDNKLAPGSIWRVQVPLGGTLDVALCSATGLWVRSNNPAVVPNNGFRERLVGGDRVLTLSGNSLGTTMLESGEGSAKWVSLQVQVVSSSSTDTKPVSIPNPEAVVPKLDSRSTLALGGIWGEVKAGQTWLATDGARLIWSASSMQVVYSINGRFFVQKASGFRGEVTTYPLIEGARRAAPMARLAEIEMKLLMGLVAGASGAGFAAVVGTELLAFVAENRDNFEKWQRQLRVVLEVRSALRAVAPTLYDKMFSAVLKQMWKDVKGQLPDSVTAETVAFGVGVVIGSVGKAATKGKFSVLGVLYVVLQQIVIRFGLNVAPHAVKLSVVEYGKLAQEVMRTLKEVGVVLTEGDAKKILDEAAKHPREIIATFEKLRGAFQ